MYRHFDKLLWESQKSNSELFQRGIFFSKIFKFYSIFDILLATNHIFSSITDNFLDKNFQSDIFLGKELTILISLLSEKNVKIFPDLYQGSK